MIYTVPWCPDIDGEIPAYVMEMLKQIDERVHHVGEPIEVGFFTRCIVRDTGLSPTAACAMVALAISLGIVGAATTMELQR